MVLMKRLMDEKAEKEMKRAFHLQALEVLFPPQTKVSSRECAIM